MTRIFAIFTVLRILPWSDSCIFQIFLVQRFIKLLKIEMRIFLCVFQKSIIIGEYIAP